MMFYDIAVRTEFKGYRWLSDKMQFQNVFSIFTLNQIYFICCVFMSKIKEGMILCERRCFSPKMTGIKPNKYTLTAV